MAITPSVAELEALILAIDVQIAELLTVPLEGSVGRTRISMRDNLKELRIQRSLYMSQLRAAKRRLGRIGHARREVF